MSVLPASRYLSYQLGAQVTAFSTLRTGGKSVGNYATFNVTDYCGDVLADVYSNRALLCADLGIEQPRLVMPHQVHGDSIRVVDADFFSSPQMEALSGIDALVTACRRCCIGVSTADCVPVLLYDPSGVVAAVHAGWRGTVARIAEKTLRRMQRDFGTVPANVRVCIGPSISMDAFEVGDEVYEAFVDAGFDMEHIAGKQTAKWHIDLWEANRLQLTDAGVNSAHIHVAGICTYKSVDRFFSARRLGIHSGRIFSGIMLNTESI